MSREIEKVSESLFEKIRSRFQNVNVGNEKAEATDDPSKARFFNFDYSSKAGEKFGNVTISIVDPSSLKVYFSKNISKELDEIQRKEWYDFLLGLRMFAKRNMMSFDTRDISRSSLELKDLKTVSKTDDAYNAKDVIGLKESKMYGNHRRSYQDLNTVRIVVNHSRPVNEEQRGARSRYIESIFVETADGERFKMPFTKLSAARAAARHIMNGGQMHDGIGQHIVSMVEEMNNMAHFVRTMRNRQFEDRETSSMVEAAVERYYQINNQLNQMQKTRGYSEFVESFTEPTQEQLNEVDVDNLKEKFVRKVFDDRLLTALPYVQRAYESHKKRQQDCVLEAKAIVEDNLPLRLNISEVEAEIAKIKTFESNEDLIRYALSTIREYAVSKSLAEFAAKWSTNYGTLVEGDDIEEEQLLAVQLVAKYLRELNELKEISDEFLESVKPAISSRLVNDFTLWADSLVEGTWALPQTDEDFKKLQEIFDTELTLGVDAENATGALYNLIGDDTLHDWLYSMYESHGAEYDVRADLANWIEEHMPTLAARLDFSQIQNTQPAPKSNPDKLPTQNGIPAKESISSLKKLAGL